ncbi:MAG: hypothetical protein K2F81_01450 [Ruminococcus sp.]|nr:hypothetical protein [Ruminococcus sp.]
MRIQRQRWVVKRNSDDKIFCGLARNYQFKSADEMGNTAIKTFLSEAKAISAVKSSYRSYTDDDITAIPVMETIESIDSVRGHRSEIGLIKDESGFGFMLGHNEVENSNKTK